LIRAAQTLTIQETSMKDLSIQRTASACDAPLSIGQILAYGVAKAPAQDAWGLPYVATMLGVKQVYPGRYVPDVLLGLIAREKVTFIGRNGIDVRSTVPSLRRRPISNRPCPRATRRRTRCARTAGCPRRVRAWRFRASSQRAPTIRSVVLTALRTSLRRGAAASSTWVRSDTSIPSRATANGRGLKISSANYPAKRTSALLPPLKRIAAR
jgi:hypothetical protein